MKTRFSLELHLEEQERLRLFQVFEYLADYDGGLAVVPRELSEHLAGVDAKGDLPEAKFEKAIGHGNAGIEIVFAGPGKVRIYDKEGSPDLKMVCQIVATVVPRLLPLEFSFALIEEKEHRYSGGLVVMTQTSTEIQTIDSMIARRGGQLFH